MWIFQNKSMISIVEDKDDPDYVVVRARVKEDLLDMFPETYIIESVNSDYQFRVFISKQEMALIIYGRIMGIDYHNFKNSIPANDDLRYNAYSSVWYQMLKFQEEKNGYKGFSRFYDFEDDGVEDYLYELGEAGH